MSHPMLDRPIAKTIMVGNVISDLFYWLEQRRTGRAPETEAVRAWEAVRPEWAGIILRHLDAYDQR